MPLGFESRRMGSKKPVTELVTGFSDSVVPPAGCPRAAGAARIRCVAPLLACCAGKRLRVSSAPHPVGFESRRWGSKKPVTAGVTGFSFQMVPPAGFEPAISTLKELHAKVQADNGSSKANVSTGALIQRGTKRRKVVHFILRRFCGAFCGAASERRYRDALYERTDQGAQGARLDC